MASTTAKRHRMRCVATHKCGHRFTLRRHPDLYVKNKYVCPVCGGRAYSDEKNRRKELKKQKRCFCLPFPHREGSILGCVKHPKPGDQWTEEERHQFDAMMETPRSG